MRVDQAIYTSLPRSGRDGYHVVSRSRGVTEADARALASWSPSHGALLVDEANRASVNIHPLAAGRLAVSRTCQGGPEYSGRGGRQVYTHALIFDASLIAGQGIAPISLYVDALALGVFRYRPDPGPQLDEVELGRCHLLRGWRDDDGDPCPLGPAELAMLRDRLARDEPVELRHAGDRCRFAARLLATLPRGLAATISLSTSLVPSSARPFALRIVP